MNGISEDSYASMLAGHSWIRFYEVWLGHGESQDAAQISNAVLETSVGIPFIARAAVGKTGDSQPDTDAVFYAACAFLVAQGPYCYFGASSGWLDQDWQWHSPYDWKVGKPLGLARRLSVNSWQRNFTHAHVIVSTQSGGNCVLHFVNGTLLRSQG